MYLYFCESAIFVDISWISLFFFRVLGYEFQEILNCKREVRLRPTTTDATAAAAPYDFLNCQHLPVLCEVLYLISFHPQKNPMRCRIIIVQKRKVRMAVKLFLSIHENET